MADNSLQGGTDTIRDLARQAGTVKTQVFQLDIGGATANAEVLVTAGQQTMALSMPVVLPSNQIVNVAQTALTKGAQGATGISTQDLKDSGRNQTNYFMAVPILSTLTDTLISLTGYKSAAAVAATTTPAVVTTGKTFRLVSVTLTYVAIATAGTVTFTLRAQVGAVVTIASPAVQVWTLGAPAAVAGVSQSIEIAVPDGFEFPAGTGIGVSIIGRGATGTAAAVGYGQLSLHGFEY